MTTHLNIYTISVIFLVFLRDSFWGLIRTILVYSIGTPQGCIMGPHIYTIRAFDWYSSGMHYGASYIHY